MALAEIKAQLGGNWKLDRSENFEEALKEMGMNLLIRKLAGAVSSSLEIDVVDNLVRIVAKASLFSRTITFKLNEEYEEEFEGINMKCVSTWEDGKLKTTSEPKEAGKVKPQKFVRERVNDELVQTMWVGDVKCVRIFKAQN
ncbi:hypothetical protein ACJMK2_012853 [Sinanodonta woodiana]|uniref:Lipocalin/cytosolic fatty-acid binding domain-containing protein n=1 Tax=Sinanodonta woodiana TaxID=1069815 RepID=A0ABD3VB54_SINWO